MAAKTAPETARATVLALAVAAGLTQGPPALSQAPARPEAAPLPQQPRPGPRSPSEEQPSLNDLALDAVEALFRALGAAFEQLPRYGLPEVRENGDIVIPRVNPPRQPRPEPERTPRT